MLQDLEMNFFQEVGLDDDRVKGEKSSVNASRVEVPREEPDDGMKFNDELKEASFVNPDPEEQEEEDQHKAMAADGEEPEEEDENAIPDGEEQEAEVNHSDEEEQALNQSQKDASQISDKKSVAESQKSGPK